MYLVYENEELREVALEFMIKYHPIQEKQRRDAGLSGDNRRFLGELNRPLEE